MRADIRFRVPRVTVDVGRDGRQGNPLAYGLGSQGGEAKIAGGGIAEPVGGFSGGVDQKVARGVGRCAALDAELSHHQVVLENVGSLVAVEENRAGESRIGGIDGIEGDEPARRIADLDGNVASRHDEIVADDAALHIDGSAGGVSEADGAVAADENVPFHHGVPGPVPQENGRSASAVLALDVPEQVVLDFPSVDLHQVDAGDVIPVEAEVGNGVGDAGDLFEKAIADDAVPGNGRVGPLNRSLAYVDEMDGVRRDCVAGPGLDVRAVSAHGSDGQVGHRYGCRLDFDPLFPSVRAAESAALEDDFARVPGHAVKRDAVLAEAQRRHGGKVVDPVGQHDGLAFFGGVDRGEKLPCI